MTTILANYTAFEYWRLVGAPGIPVPEPDNSCMIRPSAKSPRADWPIMLETMLDSGLLSRPVHIAVAYRTSHSGIAGIAVHEMSGLLPKGSLLRIDDNLEIVSPELCLIQIANVFTIAELIGLMHEFCGFYSPTESGLISRPPLTSVDRLASAAKKFTGSHGIKQFSRAVSYVKGPSRSPMETALSLCLSLPHFMGGYSLSDLELNAKVSIKPEASSKVRELEPDILFRNSRLCVEYDGRAFHEGSDAVKRDVVRTNALMTSGYKVITLTASQVMNCSLMHNQALSIARMANKRLRIRDIKTFVRQRDLLRKQVLSPQSILKNSSIPR